MKLPKKVKIVEVGLRDGLQNESVVLNTQTKLHLAEKLIVSGVNYLEAGSFVRSDKIPQMADSKEVLRTLLHTYKKVTFSGLVPNLQGMQTAMSTGIKEIAVFISSTETFSKKNINCSIDESLARLIPVMALAKKNNIKVRGYLSVCFGCPYEGQVSEKKVVKLAQRLFKMGCHEISIGDTIGVAQPGQVVSLFKKLKKVIPVKILAGHFHDTRGMALANIYAAYQLRVSIFDSSIGGLGGCPYAPGASGNVATEDVLYMFDGMNVKTGIDLQKMYQVNKWLSQKMSKPLPSKASKAYFASLS